MACSKPHAGNLRKGRYSQPGLYYFLTASVAGRRRIFTNRHRAMLVLDAIRWLQAADRFMVDAAVVMPDHLHLVGQLGESTLAKVMHTLKSYSAHGLSVAGVETPVWQKGYHDHGLRDDEDYGVRVRYVLQNPLRAGLVQRVEDYPYVILPDWWNDPYERLFVHGCTYAAEHMDVREWRWTWMSVCLVAHGSVRETLLRFVR